MHACMQRGHRALIWVAAVWSTRDMGYRMRGHAHIGRQYRYAATGHLISSGGRLLIDIVEWELYQLHYLWFIRPLGHYVRFKVLWAWFYVHAFMHLRKRAFCPFYISAGQ